MSSVEQLTHLFYQFGPFAFAVVFLFILARWSQGLWKEAEIRVPTAGLGEKRTLLSCFVATYLLGGVLAGVSVFWWWTHQPKYFFEGRIQEVSEVQSLDGDGFYSRNIYYPQTPVKDIQFLAVQSEPFIDDQQIVLTHVRDRKLEKERLVIKVKLGERPVYAMVYDEAKQQWSLQKQTSLQEKTKAGMGLDFMIRSAQAQATRSIAPSEPLRGPSGMGTVPSLKGPVPTASAPPFKPRSFKRDFEEFAENLQDPSTLISRKIDILDTLRSVPDSELREFVSLGTISGRPLKEPIFVTLTDLTRHTDREVATKAVYVLRKAPLPTAYFAQALSSKNPKGASEAINQLLRLDPQYADLVIKEMEKEGRVDVGVLRQVARAGDQWKLLVPTGTAAGDRYYMKTEWNSSETRITECMWALPSFGVFFRGIKEPQGAPNTPWLVFDNDKFKILKMAHEVEKCGAKSAFVGYYPNTKLK